MDKLFIIICVGVLIGFDFFFTFIRDKKRKELENKIEVLKNEKCSDLLNT